MYRCIGMIRWVILKHRYWIYLVLTVVLGFNLASLYKAITAYCVPYEAHMLINVTFILELVFG